MTTIKVDSPQDYFTKYISIISALSPDDLKLTPKEVMFLTECCLYNYKGNNLRDTKQLSEHLNSIKFFTRPTDTNVYKYNIGFKKWAITGRGQFELPEGLNVKEGDELTFNLKLCQ